MEKATATKTVRVLAIGNSFSHDLGACVCYEVLFATSCVGNTFTAGLDGDYARFLQKIAHRAVAAAN